MVPGAGVKPGPGRPRLAGKGWLMANKYAIAPGVVQLASGASVFVDAGSLWPSAGAVATGAPGLFAAAMSIGATGTPVANPNPVPVSVTISGGTVTGISVSGVSTGQT